MSKLIFFIKTAVINTYRNRLLWISKALSSLFCLYFALFMIGAYGGGQAFARERCSFRNADALEMYVAEEFGKLPKNPEDAEHFVFYARNEQVMYGSEYLGGVGIALTDLKFAELFDNFCARGEYISDAENECVIGNATAEKYGIKLSDKISVGARDYMVRGITANAGYRSTILLCDPRELEVGCPQIFLSSITLHGSGIKYKGEHIRDYFADMSDVSDYIPIAAVCAFMLVFSAVNVLNITLINAKKTAFTVSVHRSLGASRKVVFMIRFFGNYLINISAFAAALALTAATKRAVLIVFSTTLEFSLWGIAAAFLLAVLLSLIYSLGTPKKEGLCFI